MSHVASSLNARNTRADSSVAVFEAADEQAAESD